MTVKYANDYLFFEVRTENETPDSMAVCSGVNHELFIPLVKGRFGIGANPVSSGLQLVMYKICSLARERGATPKVVSGTGCTGIAPASGTWYTERLLIENASRISAGEVLDFGVRNLVDKLVACTWLDHETPSSLLTPEDLQVFLKDLCGKVGKGVLRAA